MHQSTKPSNKKIRVLHSVGHLLRGGIENWLFQTLTRQPRNTFEHHVLVRTSEDEAFSNAFRQAGIPVLVCTDFHNPIRYAHNLKRLIRTHGPYDILHVHGSSFSGLLTLLLAKHFGIGRTIVHSHNDVRPLLKDSGIFYGLYVRMVTAAYCILGDKGLAASVLAAESMFGMNWKRDSRWNVLYYGIDCVPFHRQFDSTLRLRLGIPEGAYVIGHVGRFHPQKNHSFLLDIIHEASEMDSNIHCLLIGDGPLLETITQEIHYRGLKKNFTIVTDTTEVSDYMISAMDCFLFPSLYEGLGLVAVEAQAAGLSCILSDRIPQEASVSPNLVKWLSLEQCPTRWARQILELTVTARRRDRTALTQIEKGRFDIERCVSSLQIQYLQLTSR
jgi:glycosyltransferase involved in cell wall biosynthesis